MAVLPYGSWPSPITADLLVQRVVGLQELEVAGGVLWWNERRPAESGRQVVVRRSPDGQLDDMVPPGFSARTTVHEYGGGAYTVAGEALFFSNMVDQRLWRVDPGAAPRPLTPEHAAPGEVRFADTRATPDGAWLLCVRERHLAGEVVNDVVAVASDGEGEPRQLLGGHDFFAAPRPSPDGRRLAWLTWDHPNMPWDGTELWVADIGTDVALSSPRRVAGGPQESVSQPRWSPDGVLHWVSDATGWWNLYAEGVGALAPMEAEFSGPDWVFGQSTYTFLADGTLVAAWSQEGVDRLGVVVPGQGVERLDVPFTSFQSLRGWGPGIVVIAASASQAAAIVAVDLTARPPRVEVLRPSRDDSVDPGMLSAPRPLRFPSAGGRTAHALYYPPANSHHEGPDGDRPPVVVVSHGGPTGAASPVLNLQTQLWTSRGVAVVDVNYAGSTGYGRAYRRLLDGQWGVADVEDCVAAARHLVEEGEVDGDRLAIRGTSAGGFTTLCALAFTDAFAVGASWYGVADLEALAADTHKFESRYLDRLVGLYPDAATAYRDRSPVNVAGRISCPVILLQGLDDRVVPPAQAEAMAAALRDNRIPFAYLEFPGEQHGFRSAEVVKRAAEAELWFVGKVLGFDPADELEPVAVENLDRLSG